ncbi:MAG: hypothetical protein J6038_03265 [Bacilli bacterium]|nr:hypothetical protein [Bacilli bacterium]
MSEDKTVSFDPQNARFISEGSDSYIFDNGRIHLEVGKQHGEFRSLKNREANQELIVSSVGLPFYLEYGYNRRQVAISEDCPSIVSSVSLSLGGEKEVLTLHYDDLAANKTGKGTGIQADVAISIGEGDYFSYSCAFDLSQVPASGVEGEENGIYALKLMNGKLKGAGENQRLTAPTWNGGQYWKEPWLNKTFVSASGGILGYPGIDSSSLQAGWLDFSGDEGGIGIGLINRQQLVTEFRIKGDSANKAMCLSNVIFEPSQVLGESVPLLRGESFQSDPIYVTAHHGDWHDTADVYRKEYEKAFALGNGGKDYLDAGNMSRRARDLDYITRAFSMIYLGSPTTFEKMYNDTNNLMNEIEGDWEHHAFWLAGQNEQGYAYDVPFMTPTYGPSGGDEGLKNLAERFQAKNGSIYVYEHPFAVDPDRPEIQRILSSVDPGQHTEYWDGVTHHSVCIDNDVMLNLWENEILPPQIALGVNGWQLDQCPLVQTICDMPGHSHGLDAISRLSSHAKGVIALQKMIRSKVDDCYLVSESYSDILSRYCDVAQLCWHAPLLWDGYWEYGAMVYTHPSLVYQPSTSGLFWDYDYDKYLSENLILQGALYGGIDCLSDGGEISVKKEFARFKKEIRQVEHSGYPFGFRDNLGLSVSDHWLDARVYVEGDYVTIVTLANASVKDAKIEVDLERLGFQGKGNREFDVTQSMGTLRYIHFNINDPA